jgi:hypothetical protein
MANTYTICEVTVTIPKIGIVSSDKEGNEFKCGEIYHINLFAMRPGWSNRLSDFEGLIVGRLDFSGYSESQFSRTQKIIMPNGYELVALRVGESGRPITWESLPVLFVGDPISLKDADDTVRVRMGKIHSAEPFSIRDAKVFIHDAFIRDGVSVANHGVGLNVDNDSREMRNFDHHDIGADSFEVKTVVTYPAALGAAMEMSLNDDTSKAITKLVNDTIRKALQPGGAIWSQRKGR